MQLNMYLYLHCLPCSSLFLPLTVAGDTHIPLTCQRREPLFSHGDAAGALGTQGMELRCLAPILERSVEKTLGLKGQTEKCYNIHGCIF